MPKSLVMVSDRGGHWANARMLLEQMQVNPNAVITTFGPEVEPMRRSGLEVHVVPYLFSWFGKRRIWNPLKFVVQMVVSLYWVLRLRPHSVVSLGASNVVPFCYWARLFGSRVYHVECMNQVWTPSVTGKMLYPICEVLYVQWPELLKHYGSRAKYAGWVL